ADYISGNSESYVLPGIVVSVVGKCKFVRLSTSASSVESGTLTLPIDAKIQIHDGQHRVAAIIAAVAKDASLADETIAVVIYPEPTDSKTVRHFGDIRANQ